TVTLRKPSAAPTAADTGANVRKKTMNGALSRLTNVMTSLRCCIQRKCGRALCRSTGPAVVLSVDEKRQIRALDRTQPGLPMKQGRAGTMIHDYKRHGTTTLRLNAASSDPSSAYRPPSTVSPTTTTLTPNPFN